MNETPDRGPRDPEDDHSQNTEQRDDPTEEERDESLNKCLIDMARSTEMSVMNRKHLSMMLDNAEEELDMHRAVTDAAVMFVHAKLSYRAGIPDNGMIKKTEDNLFVEVEKLLEREQDL